MFNPFEPLLDFLAFLLDVPLVSGTFIALLVVFIWNERRLGGAFISPSQLVQLINRDHAIVVDLRSENEFRQGHIQNAINLPYESLAESTEGLEPHRDKSLVLVCRLGQHSGNVGRRLIRAGFKVKRLSGGISEWTAASMLLVK